MELWPMKLRHRDELNKDAYQTQNINQNQTITIIRDINLFKIKMFRHHLLNIVNVS